MSSLKKPYREKKTLQIDKYLAQHQMTNFKTAFAWKTQK